MTPDEIKFEGEFAAERGSDIVTAEIMREVSNAWTDQPGQTASFGQWPGHSAGHHAPYPPSAVVMMATVTIAPKTISTAWTASVTTTAFRPPSAV